MSSGKVSYSENNNHKQAKSGTATMKKPGPAKGRGSGNPTKKGGVMEGTKGKY